MSFKINTNVSAMNAHTSSLQNNRNLSGSLAKLSSGLRINNAADDASGMAIADSLRSQASSLGQAISNSNDAIGLIQTADKAMDEQIKILDTIKAKAIQAASDTQTTSSREAIQKDVNRLIEQLNNIAKTTSFNGQVLLSGKYANKEFQVGAFSNQTINASISNTQSVAVGNMATRSDIVQLGNTTSVNAAAGANATVLSFANPAGTMGMAAGDTIRIDGVGDYTIKSVASAGVTLNEGLAKAITAGTNIAVVSNVAENISKIAAFTVGAAAGFSISVGDADGLKGFAVGDKIQVTNSAGNTSVLVVQSISAGGSISVAISGTGGVTAGSVFANSTLDLVGRGTVGTAFAAEDYVKYTVEGMDLTGVQLTDKDGNGVADTGLGKVADLINEATSTTGVKAVANVEANSLIGVQGGGLSADMKINGVVIMEAGQVVEAGDRDNALVSAINAKSDITGVEASLEGDGTLTVKSDGRAMKLEGFTTPTGINDGVVAGELSLSKNGLEVMDVKGSHFSDAGLTKATTDASSLTETVNKHSLSELVTGQRDSNGDGKIDDKDAVGLMMTQEGAMLAMDIAEAATGQLDAIRADLGSVQNQLTVTVNNISVTQVNVKAAESQLRDVDFASESANFSKFNILAQSGSYAMSQANAVQQNVLRLLQ